MTRGSCVHTEVRLPHLFLVLNMIYWIYILLNLIQSLAYLISGQHEFMGSAAEVASGLKMASAGLALWKNTLFAIIGFPVIRQMLIRALNSFGYPERPTGPKWYLALWPLHHMKRSDGLVKTAIGGLRIVSGFLCADTERAAGRLGSGLAVTLSGALMIWHKGPDQKQSPSASLLTRLGYALQEHAFWLVAALSFTKVPFEFLEWWPSTSFSQGAGIGTGTAALGDLWLLTFAMLDLAVVGISPFLGRESKAPTASPIEQG